MAVRDFVSRRRSRRLSVSSSCWIRVKMQHWSGKVAIVTGASTGIGADIVKALVRAGVKVVGVARRIEKIQELSATLRCQKGALYPMECDVRKEKDILRVFEWTERKLGGVDILVNNAGVLVVEPIIDGSTENYRKIMEVNVIAVAICTREAVRSMRRRDARGHIININSVAGHNAEIMTFQFSLYAASKFALTAMTQSVTNELTAAKINVKVTSISAGAVKTDLISGLEVLTDDVKRGSILTGKDIADAVIYALDTPPNVQVKELTVTPLTDFRSSLENQ